VHPVLVAAAACWPFSDAGLGEESRTRFFHMPGRMTCIQAGKNGSEHDRSIAEPFACGKKCGHSSVHALSGRPHNDVVGRLSPDFLPCVLDNTDDHSNVSAGRRLEWRSLCDE
jgi:hypothetical protein